MDMDMERTNASRALAREQESERVCERSVSESERTTIADGGALTGGQLKDEDEEGRGKKDRSQNVF